MADKFTLPTEWMGRLETIGRIAYGSNWRVPVCKELGISRVLLARWRSGASVVPDDLNDRLGKMLHRRMCSLAALRDCVGSQGDWTYRLDDERLGLEQPTHGHDHDRHADDTHINPH